jgi:hypothetical protein
VRPHLLLYSEYEKTFGLAPTTLPPLQHSYFDQLDPRKGNLMVASDRNKIENLLVQLEPFMKTVSVGYVEDRAWGMRTGKGKFTWAWASKQARGSAPGPMALCTRETG